MCHYFKIFLFFYLYVEFFTPFFHQFRHHHRHCLPLLYLPFLLPSSLHPFANRLYCLRLSHSFSSIYLLLELHLDFFSSFSYRSLIQFLSLTSLFIYFSSTASPLFVPFFLSIQHHHYLSLTSPSPSHTCISASNRIPRSNISIGDSSCITPRLTIGTNLDYGPGRARHQGVTLALKKKR